MFAYNMPLRINWDRKSCNSCARGIINSNKKCGISKKCGVNFKEHVSYKNQHQQLRKEAIHG